MKNALANVKMSLNRFGGRTSLALQKKSPEICLGIGVIGFVGTVVLACRATLKSEEILDRHMKRMEAAKEAVEVAVPEDHFDIRREKTVIWAHTMVDFAKLYAPCAALGAVSIACFGKMYKTLNGRYIGAVSALNGVTEAFQTYRNRVIAEEGEEKDRHYRYGAETETVEVTEVNENGNEVKKTEVHEKMENPLRPSDYARYFDETNPNWNENPQLSLMFLKGQEQMLNDILHTKGHVFLNQVYDALGYGETPIGQLYGWTMDGGSGYIDFGLYNKENQDARRFVNGKESIVLLDFNVDGVILNKIPAPIMD